MSIDNSTINRAKPSSTSLESLFKLSCSQDELSLLHHHSADLKTTLETTSNDLLHLDVINHDQNIVSLSQESNHHVNHTLDSNHPSNHNDELRYSLNTTDESNSIVNTRKRPLSSYSFDNVLISNCDTEYSVNDSYTSNMEQSWKKKALECFFCNKTFSESLQVIGNSHLIISHIRHNLPIYLPIPSTLRKRNSRCCVSCCSENIRLINERYKSVIIPEHTISNCENDPCCLCGGLIYKSSESTRLYCYANRNDAYIGKKNCYIMGNQLTSLSNTRVCAKCLNNNYTMAKRLQGQPGLCYQAVRAPSIENHYSKHQQHHDTTASTLSLTNLPVTPPFLQNDAPSSIESFNVDITSPLPSETILDLLALSKDKNDKLDVLHNITRHHHLKASPASSSSSIHHVASSVNKSKIPSSSPSLSPYLQQPAIETSKVEMDIAQNMTNLANHTTPHTSSLSRTPKKIKIRSIAPLQQLYTMDRCKTIDNSLHSNVSNASQQSHPSHEPNSPQILHESTIKENHHYHHYHHDSPTTNISLFTKPLNKKYPDLSEACVCVKFEKGCYIQHVVREKLILVLHTRLAYDALKKYKIGRNEHEVQFYHVSESSYLRPAAVYTMVHFRVNMQSIQSVDSDARMSWVTMLIHDDESF